VHGGLRPKVYSQILILPAPRQAPLATGPAIAPSPLWPRPAPQAVVDRTAVFRRQRVPSDEAVEERGRRARKKNRKSGPQGHAEGSGWGKRPWGPS
jgi:hypothetical protein